ncbi:MAG TPA: ice-binding family protein, partial [Prolixibacteraceae bacterium]
MKLANALSTSALLLVVLISGCSKDLNNVGSSATPSPEKSAVISSTENTGGLQLKSALIGGVDLKSAGNFVILSKTGITSVYKSTITGDIGTSPITGAAMVVNCGEVTGSVYSVDAAGPACKTTSATMLTAAVGDMQAAYTDAAGRINPDFLNLGAGNIGGKTLTAGLYKWTTALIIPTDITITGAPDDIFIFQVSGTLIMSSA